MNHLGMLVLLIAIPVLHAAAQSPAYSKGEISFDSPQYFTKSMFHCFNIEELCDKAPKVDKSAVTVMVTDKDADRFPGSIDEVQVFVWSDTDAKGMTVTAHETHINSGVFVGTFGITDSTSYQNKIQVRDGDTLLAKYVDDTVPGGKSEDLTTTSFIGMLGIPIEIAPAYNLRILDNKGNKIDSVESDQQILITSELKNSASKSQNFSYILQIQNEKEESVLLSWVDGMLVAKQHIEPAISWIPKTPGTYTATIFVWESLDNPTALSPPIQMQMDVSEQKHPPAVPQDTECKDSPWNCGGGFPDDIHLSDCDGIDELKTLVWHCPTITTPTDFKMLNSSGFAMCEKNDRNYYILEAGKQGSFTYQISRGVDLNDPPEAPSQVEMIKEPEFACEYANNTRMSCSGDGIHVAYEPESVVLGFNQTGTITATITADAAAKRQSLWLGLTPYACFGGTYQPFAIVNHDKQYRKFEVLSVSPQNVTLPSVKDDSWSEYTTKEHIGKSKPIEIVDGVKSHLLMLTIHDATIHTRYNSSENKYNTLVFSYSVENPNKDSIGASLAFEGHFGSKVYRSQNGTDFASTLWPGQIVDSTFAIDVDKGANQILLIVKDQKTDRTLWSIPVTWMIPSLKENVLTQE